MEIENLKRISISNLILIIINDKNNDLLRKCAEVELKKRIRNFGWQYYDLLHFDDKVIKERGLDIDNYLISPNVNMQQLMEVFFMYNKNTDYDSNYLLFSEKHLCNQIDYFDKFFSKICAQEIKNIDKRLNGKDIESQKEILVSVKNLLLEREQTAKEWHDMLKKDSPIYSLAANEAAAHLDTYNGSPWGLLTNISDEELYKNFSSKLGTMKLNAIYTLEEILGEIDIIEYLWGLRFISKDSAKLKKQKRQLLQQVMNGYEVDYQTDTMQKALQIAKNRK